MVVKPDRCSLGVSENNVLAEERSITFSISSAGNDPFDLGSDDNYDVDLVVPL